LKKFSFEYFLSYDYNKNMFFYKRNNFFDSFIIPGSKNLSFNEQTANYIFLPENTIHFGLKIEIKIEETQKGKT